MIAPTSAPAADGRRTDPTVTDVPLWHRRGAIGVLLVATGCLLAAFSTGEVDTTVPMYYVGSIAAVIVVWVAVGRSSDRRTLLAWPLAVMVGMVLASYLAPLAAALCMASLVLAFLFVGLTQRPGGSLFLMPVAVATYMVVFDLPLEQFVVKLAIAASVWVAVAELPAWLTDSLRSARIEMERLAATDTLTGLANRRWWDMQLPLLLEEHPSAVVVLIDLDHFKTFNDTRGHLAGDKMLADFARSIARAVPEGGIAARWGGEEFALALSDAVQARLVADEIRRNVPHGQTCSIGMAEHRPGEPQEELVRRADEALYVAKNAGRNRIVAA